MNKKYEYRKNAEPGYMNETIFRIQRMEIYYDTLRNVLQYCPEAVSGDEYVSGMLSALREYFTSGQWQTDYALDEAGVIPKELKRGVLGQDSIHELLCAVMESEKDRK